MNGEPSEYDRMQERIQKNGRPEYSLGHRAMYHTVAELLRGKPASILEVGFGIGYGLEQLLKARCVGYYEGTEPDRKSYGYVTKKFGETENTEFHNRPWPFQPNGTDFDFAICMEVLEHVPEEQLQDFVMGIRLSLKPGGTFFASTPNSDTHGHGALNPEQWREVFRGAGFEHVTAVEWQWTTLYVAQ